MDINFTVNSLDKIIDLANESVNEGVELAKDLFEEYRVKEEHNRLVIQVVAYVLATLIIVSNLTVVLSSGLILRRGQKKSTYLLLGNVSLSDTIVGITLLYGASSQDNTVTSSAMCILQMGTLVCTAMVSIFSVGLIAVDRYIYILHGLYYQRWFNTTRVRIGIFLIWMIGIILGFMPATGWVNDELTKHSRCYYLSLFPPALIFFNSFISILPIVVVTVVYAIILFKAIKTVNKITNTDSVKTATSDGPQLRIHRSSVNSQGLNSETEIADIMHMRRSSSMNRSESNMSVSTVETTASVESLPDDNTNRSEQFVNSTKKSVNSGKIKEPNKWRAIKVVMLTTASFMFTWMPFFIVAILFVFCGDQLKNPRCIKYRALIGGELAILAFINSMLNPLIYAWWHKGFNTFVRNYYSQCMNKLNCRH